MPALPEYSVALDRYDRHVPFFTGVAQPKGDWRIRAMEVGMVPPRRDGVQRHRRMLQGEFDMGEMSLASYIMARQAGVALTAVPVFPRRLFSQNHIFVRRDGGISSPMDLKERRVGIWAFQVTMSVLAKGDLKSDYGLDWRELQWVSQHPEETPWDPPPGVRLTLAPPGRTLADMLLAGEIDAYIDPHPPASVIDNPDRVRRLFADAEAECQRYLGRHGYYPIMHLLAIKDEVARRHPDLPAEMMRLWEEAKEIAAEAYVDTGFSLFPLGRHAFERAHAALPGDLWPSGLAGNRANLERFIEFMVDQKLLQGPVAPEALFHESVRGS